MAVLLRELRQEAKTCLSDAVAYFAHVLVMIFHHLILACSITVPGSLQCICFNTRKLDCVNVFYSSVAIEPRKRFSNNAGPNSAWLGIVQHSATTLGREGNLMPKTPDPLPLR